MADTVQLADAWDVEDYEGVSDVFRCLSAPLRVAIIDRLGAGPACVHELVAAFSATQPLVSQHLRILRAAGFVTRTRRGREIAYALADDHVAHVVRDALRHATEVARGSARGLAPTDPELTRDGLD